MGANPLDRLSATRAQEIGIRMALGADRTNIRNWVLRQGVLLTITGVLIGVGAAFGLTRLIAGFLFGVRTWDPVVFIAVPMLLTIVALLATWAPARMLPIGSVGITRGLYTELG